MNEEGLDDYWIDQLIITFNHGQDENVVKIKPEGANVIMCEDLLQIGCNFLAYMLKDSPQLWVDRQTGLPKPAYEGIDVDGWYWIESRGEGYAHFVNKPLLLKLIDFPGK